jgi:hypothetical protein
MTETARPIRPEAIQSAICEGIKEIGRFTVTTEFQRLIDDLYRLPKVARPAFVQEVILSEEERRRRGIIVPADMVVQRSTFADGRPTLFCVSKILPHAYPWHRVTITFDSGMNAAAG